MKYRFELKQPADVMQPGDVYTTDARIVCYICGSTSQPNPKNVAFLAETGKSEYGFIHFNGAALPLYSTGNKLCFKAKTSSGAIENALKAGRKVMAFNHWTEFAEWLSCEADKDKDC